MDAVNDLVKDLLTQERLKEVLHYDPETGLFTWLHNLGRPNGRGWAGHVHRVNGYVKIMVDKKLYSAHRLAWLYQTGEFPVLGIDHIDRVRTNNRFDNLREATQSQNLANTSPKARNKLGLKGVREFGRKFQAGLRVNGRTKHLGMFSTAEEAHAAYVAAVKDNFGEFAGVA